MFISFLKFPCEVNVSLHTIPALSVFLFKIKTAVTPVSNDALGKGDQFKREYRDVDLLLVDDIQFLANKEQTQEEFFHTFNALHQSNKQIILTSDRPPKSISVIEARLVSRFEWGMIADVGRPDLETRVAIVQRQTQDRGFPLPPDVVNFIAEAVTNNVRELEGALTKLHAYYQLNKVVPNVDVARSLIAALQGDGALGGGLTPKRVIAAVAKYFDVSLENLLGASRRKELVVPRQIAMYLLREDCSSSFPSIGHELGGRDHTTAMHACGKVRKEVERGGKMRGDVEQIRLALGGS
jgi:chromosomal replication initiator protein